MFKPYFNFRDNKNSYYPLHLIKKEGEICCYDYIRGPKFQIRIFIRNELKYFYYDSKETRDKIYAEIKKLKWIK